MLKLGFKEKKKKKKVLKKWTLLDRDVIHVVETQLNIVVVETIFQSIFRITIAAYTVKLALFFSMVSFPNKWSLTFFVASVSYLDNYMIVKHIQSY